VISNVKTAINIILDVLFISTYRVTPGTPSINVQAIIRLICDAAGALTGLIYYLSISGLLWTPFRPLEPSDPRRPNLPGLVLMTKPGSYTFAESAIRNALYMWLISGIVSLGNKYATAWAIFNTIRWGLVMVPVYSLEATTSTFVGHAWGYFRSLGKEATNRDIFQLMKPALLSCFIALCIEIPLCLIMTFKTAYPFALYLSNDPAVAEITAKMWRSIDWCYIFYAVTTQLSSVLLATRPRWYLAQSLVSNILWVLPWAIVVQVVGLDSGNPWMWYAIVFGGSLVFSFGAVTAVLAAWARGLKKGKLGEVPEGTEERAD
jgi:Na+-driven multidrug efflux pump